MPETLSHYEQECLLFAAQDKGIVETARLLGISESVVKKRRSAILQKTRCKTLVGALAVAVKEKLIRF